VTGCIVPDQHDHGVGVLLLEFKQEDVGSLAIKTIHTHEVETLTFEGCDRREEIPIIKLMLLIDDCSFAHLRPTPSEVGDETVPHLITEIELVVL
jgi:hypothetical protein